MNRFNLSFICHILLFLLSWLEEWTFCLNHAEWARGKRWLGCFVFSNFHIYCGLFYYSNRIITIILRCINYILDLVLFGNWNFWKLLYLFCVLAVFIAVLKSEQTSPSSDDCQQRHKMASLIWNCWVAILRRCIQNDMGDDRDTKLDTQFRQMES